MFDCEAFLDPRLASGPPCDPRPFFPDNVPPPRRRPVPGRTVKALDDLNVAVSARALLQKKVFITFQKTSKTFLSKNHVARARIFLVRQLSLIPNTPGPFALCPTSPPCALHSPTCALRMPHIPPVVPGNPSLFFPLCIISCTPPPLSFSPAHQHVSQTISFSQKLYEQLHGELSRAIEDFSTALDYVPDAVAALLGRGPFQQPPPCQSP